MSGKTIDRTRERRGGESPPQATRRKRSGDPAGHPLDAWLRRELRDLDPEAAGERLPPGIAALAERLEARLREAEDEADADPRGEDADRATTS